MLSHGVYPKPDGVNVTITTYVNVPTYFVEEPVSDASRRAHPWGLASGQQLLQPELDLTLSLFGVRDRDRGWREEGHYRAREKI